MDNQNDDDLDIDDDVFIDGEDESFEDEYDDEYGFDDDDDDDVITLEDDEILDPDAEDDWEDDEVEGGLGAQKEKRFNVDLSFNAMAIIGALVLGVGVLIFQVMTTKPEMNIDTFRSALNMGGASDGPIFGDEEVETAEIKKSDTDNLPKNKGFLYEPDVLDSMEMNIEDAPPQPTPISQDESENKEDATSDGQATLTPMADMGEVNQVPRPPEDASPPGQVAEIQQPQQSGQTDEPTSIYAGTELPDAQDFLKSALDARRKKKSEEAKAAANNDAAVEIPEIKKEPPQEAEPVESVQENLNAMPMTMEEPKEPKQEMANQQVTSTIQSTNVSSNVEAKLDMIVGRLEDMEAEIRQIRESENSQIENISEKLEGLEKEMGQIGTAAASMKKTTSTPKKTVKQTPKKVTKKAAPKKKATPKKVASTARWELRAAQPGKAWVAKRGQNSMQPVVVGDTLSGIGRVNAITYNGGRWVVQGSQGQILQ